MTSGINLFALNQEVTPRETVSEEQHIPEKRATEPEDLYKKYRMFIEALLFASSEPLSFQKIRESIDPSMTLKPRALEKILETLKDEYIIEKRGFRLVETAEGFLMKTPEELSSFLEAAFKNRRGERLSQAAAEVLAIIVHRQPITRAEVEAIRGVDCTGTIASLFERGLIAQVGRAEAPGRPSLWAVTQSFLTHFGLKDLSEIKH